MKKLLFSAVAAGALVVGGAASAQDPGAVLKSGLGIGVPTYGSPQYAYGNPPPYVVDPVQGNGSGGWIDAYGREVVVTPYGRQLAGGAPVAAAGVTGYDVYGRPIYGNISQAGRFGRDR